MSPRITAGYTVLMAVLGVAVFAAPAWSAYTWAAIGLLSVAAIVVGSRVHAPYAAPRRSPWWLLAGAVFVMGVGDVIYGATVHHQGDSPPTIDDIFYFAMFPLVTAGLIDMTRTGAVIRDRSRSLDLFAFSCSATLAAWAFLISPTLDAATLSIEDKSSLAAYTIGDLLILLALVRLLVAARRSWALALLAAGAIGLLASDVAYALARLGAGWAPGGPAELGYLLFYVAWGAAALHPSMAKLTAPVEARSTQLRGGWTALLGVSLAIPPATLFVESLTGHVRDGLMIAGTSIVTFALVITRLADALKEHRGAVTRERALREACGALVAAASNHEVTTAMRAGVSTLMPDGVEHSMLLRFNDDDEAMSYPLPPEAANRRTRIVPTQLLRPDLRVELDAFPGTLVCPLIVDRRAARDPGAGALFVAAPEWALTATQDAVEVLAAQTALALERIALTEAANRRDNDRYLQTVVQNTADVVLIIDDDQRIRYASPSLAAVLDITPPACGTLRDIVHPDDHDQVVRTLAMAEHFGEADGARDVWSLRRPDGTRVLVEVSYRDLRHDRIVRGFVVTMRDITREQPQRDEASRRALEASPAGQNRRNVAKKFT